MRSQILRKATIRFVMSVRPSVRMENKIPTPTARIFMNFWNLRIFRKSVLENLVSLPSDENDARPDFSVIPRSVSL